MRIFHKCFYTVEWKRNGSWRSGISHGCFSGGRSSSPILGRRIALCLYMETCRIRQRTPIGARHGRAKTRQFKEEKNILSGRLWQICNSCASLFKGNDIGCYSEGGRSAVWKEVASSSWWLRNEGSISRSSSSSSSSFFFFFGPVNYTIVYTGRGRRSETIYDL